MPPVMSWNPCSSPGDAVADDAVADATASQPLLGCSDGGSNGSNSENGADATKPPAANGQGEDGVNAGLFGLPPFQSLDASATANHLPC